MMLPFKMTPKHGFSKQFYKKNRLLLTKVPIHKIDWFMENTLMIQTVFVFQSNHLYLVKVYTLQEV